MNLKELKWPQVVLILGTVFMIMAGVIVLTFLGKDPSGVLTFGGVLLGGLGVGALATGQSAIKEHVNGRWSQMMMLLEKQSDQLARSAPIDVASTPAKDA